MHIIEHSRITVWMVLTVLLQKINFSKRKHEIFKQFLEFETKRQFLDLAFEIMKYRSKCSISEN